MNLQNFYDTTDLDEKVYRDYIENIGKYSYGMYHLSSLLSVKNRASIKGSEEVDIYDAFNDSTFLKNIKGFIDSAKKINSDFCQNCSEKTLNINNLRKGSFILRFNAFDDSDISMTYMQHILFEFIFNALKHMTTISEPVIHVSSLVGSNGIQISNKVSKKFDYDEFMLKWDSDEIKERGLGVHMIKNIIREQEYIIEPKLESNLFSFIIKRSQNE